MKPTCGRCSQNSNNDCEYTDEGKQSRAQALQETISQLEARIRDLEHPELTTPSIVLHDPHSGSALPQFSPPALDYGAFDNTSDSADPNSLSVVLDDSYCTKSEQLSPLPLEYPTLDSTCDYSPISTPLSSMFGRL